MDRVPGPLQVGSPTIRRQSSAGEVPSALLVGSPVVERGTPPFQQRPALTRKNTSGSDRLSQLFPSRPPSVASASPDWPASRRTSYPSPLTPGSDPSYRIPRAPAPPTFSEDTSYASTPDPFAQQFRQPISRSSGTKRLLSRLTSRARGGEYNRLGDDEYDKSSRRLKGVQEDEEHVGFDISGFGGLPLKDFEPRKTNSTIDQHDLDEAGYAAEYEILEGKLFGGMSSVVERPFEYKPQRSGEQIGHQRGLSSSDVAAAAVAAQREAEKTGDIVMVSEIPVDISDAFTAPDAETRSVLTTGYGQNGESKTSYYFPDDPDMPSWRPFSMGWPWLSLLVSIALTLAGVQEYLCQLSMRSAKNPLLGEDIGGLKTFTNPKELSVAVYFTWKYAPVLFFVIYGIMWQVSDFEVKRLEPFYQLSKKTGATAGQSLNMDYLTFLQWLVPLRALRHKQYAVIYVSLCTLVSSSLVPILQSASVEVYPPKDERDPDKLKAIRIDPTWSRPVSACLVFVAICGSVLIYEMRRKSGLLSDPSGIAGVAAMATRSHILTEFRGLDKAPLSDIHKKLRHRRYILHKSSLWQGEWIANSTEKIQEHGIDPRPLMLRLRAGVPYLCFMVCFWISIPIFMFMEGANNVTEKLPFLLTTLAIMVKLLWGTLNNDIRMLEPFHLLSRRNAPAKTLTLDYTGTNPLFLPVKALLNRHYLVAAVGVGAILAEVLTVCVSSFTVDGKRFIPGQGIDNDDKDKTDKSRANTDETFKSFWISFALVLAIMVYLVITAGIVYWRRSHKFMPRQTGTMASVLAFIHQSKMLYDFIGTEKFNSGQMTRHLEKKGKRYGLGWFVGRDGEDHCGIDEEPLVADYVYGKDRAQGRLRARDIGRWEHYDA